MEDAAAFTSEECNCVIRANGSRSRRLGIDYEEGHKLLPNNSFSPNLSYAYSATEWTDVNEGNSQHYFVVQSGPKLYFYKNVGAPFSQAPQDFVLDLTEFALPEYLIVKDSLVDGSGTVVGSVSSEGVISFTDGTELGTINANNDIFSGAGETLTYVGKYIYEKPPYVLPEEKQDEEDFKYNGKVCTVRKVAEAPCRYTQAYGGLFVCSTAIQPFFIDSLDKPETKSSESFYNRIHTVLSFKAWNDYSWCREYDPYVRFMIDDEVFAESLLRGRYIYGPKRWVVKDSEGTKIGRVPGSAQDLRANPEGKSYIYAWNSDTVIGQIDVNPDDADSTVAKDLQGNTIGTAYLANDFWETKGEAGWATDGKNKTIAKPNVHYYVKLWNEHVPVGQTKTARERTNLKAVAVTPYSSDNLYSFNVPEGNVGDVVKTVSIPEIPLTVEVEKTSNNNAQDEYIVFYTDDPDKTTAHRNMAVEFQTWTDKISHRDERKYTRNGVFTEQYRYQNKHGLVLQIRDFKGTEDLYAPVEGGPKLDLRIGPNVAIRPTGDLTDAHKYNLYNQGWQGSRFFKEEEDTDPHYAQLIQHFHDYTASHEEYSASWPSNNLQWFVGKETDTKYSYENLLANYTNFTNYRIKDLLQHSFGETPAPRGRYILDYFKQDRASVSGIGEGVIPVEYPRCPYVSDITTFAGRIFYLTGDTVLYSQVILEDLSKAGNCYQEADPTCEEFPDIVDTDGGMIQIPEIGEGVKLVHIGGILAVVGTRSTYLISGGSENNFTATAYVGGAIQTYSSSAPLSFVEAEGGVYYWSKIGIVQLAGSQGGLVSNVISQNTIQTFYDSIPDFAKDSCKGFFDNATKEIWWLYPSSEDKPKILDKALVLNLKTGAWTPIQFATDPEGVSTYPFVASGLSIAEAFKVDHIGYIYAEHVNEDGTVDVVPVSYEVSEDLHRSVLVEEPVETDRLSYRSSLFCIVDPNLVNMSFGVLNNLNYKDWAKGDVKGSGYDYESYLISHPIVLDRPYQNKTTPYLLATFRRSEQGSDLLGNKIYPSACKGAVLWDWNTNGDAGKWDAAQELYRYDENTLMNNKYISSKTRVYGSGRAFQIKLSSVDNKGFDIENIGFQAYIDGRI
jgi:hypothetical protein